MNAISKTEPGDLKLELLNACIADHVEFENHEEVVKCSDPKSGLLAFIAVHSTRLGPSLGGTRMWAYSDEKAAIHDVLRLSKGMSFKHAIAGTGRGGGKAVIVGDSKSDKTPEKLRAFGRFVDSLQGRYITAEDVGMCVDDMLIVKEMTQHISGLPLEVGGSGDPSPITAYGVYCGIIASLAWREGLNKDSIYDADLLRDKTIAVQGLGHVGIDLCQQLHEKGAKLIVSDVNESQLELACDKFGANKCPVDEILRAPADVFAPCALGGVLDAESIDILGAKIVAGAANNQLATHDDGQRVQDAGITYAPDFVINAGGIINIANEGPPYDVEAARAQTRLIAETLWDIYSKSKVLNRPTSVVADELAMEKLAKG